MVVLRLCSGWEACWRIHSHVLAFAQCYFLAVCCSGFRQLSWLGLCLSSMRFSDGKSIGQFTINGFPFMQFSMFAQLSAGQANYC